MIYIWLLQHNICVLLLCEIDWGTMLGFLMRLWKFDGIFYFLNKFNLNWTTFNKLNLFKKIFPSIFQSLIKNPALFPKLTSRCTLVAFLRLSIRIVSKSFQCIENDAFNPEGVAMDQSFAFKFLWENFQPQISPIFEFSTFFLFSILLLGTVYLNQSDSNCWLFYKKSNENENSCGLHLYCNTFSIFIKKQSVISEKLVIFHNTKDFFCPVVSTD
jgi:hypothetical protein